MHFYCCENLENKTPIALQKEQLLFAYSAAVMSTSHRKVGQMILFLAVKISNPEHVSFSEVRPNLNVG